MIIEKDLNMQRSRENGSGSACSRTTILTLKSAHTSRTGPSDSRRTRSSISSRARQIKDHEGDPFLSIDVLPKNNNKSSFRQDPVTPRYSTKGRELSRLTTSSIGTASANSYGRDSELPGVFSRYASAVRSASLIGQARFQQHTNVYVRMPFKQVADVPCIEKTRMMSVFPGRALVENTTLAVHIANQILREHEQQKIVHFPGRLLKARLKNLDPVRVDGPTICQCRGITSETRSPLLCNRRTYHRIMAILSKAHPPKDVQGMSNPVSVHWSSEASSLDSEIHAAFIKSHDLHQTQFQERTAENEIVDS